MKMHTVVINFVFAFLAAGCELQYMSSEQCRDKISSITKVSGFVESLQGQCEGTGYFELASAGDALRSGDFEAAHAWVDAGMKVPGFDVLPFYEMEFAINEESNSPGRNKFIADALVGEHPEAAAGYFLLGKYYTVRGSYLEAIENLEKARVLNGDLAVFASNKLLISLYWEVDRFVDSAAAYDSAERAFPEKVHSDWTLMRIAVAANYLSGNYDRARSVLELQLILYPESSSDHHVRRLVADLAGKGFVVKGYDPSRV